MGDPGTRPPRSRLFPAAVVVTACLGVGAVIGGMVLAGQSVQPGPPAVEASPSPAASPNPDAKSPEEASTLEREPGLDPAWLARVAEGAGMPERALAAYATASLTIAAESPGCGLGWNTLAAIGHVESGHGSIDGAVLHDDGRVLPRVLGVPLDGSSYALVADTDGGSLDGDSVVDRAVGPMQFLPATWAAYGHGGDIDNLDDAALAAGRMLCAVGGDLSVAGNWIAAVDTYNPNVAYNHRVVDAADFYAQFN